jgi:hypothetical protein
MCIIAGAAWPILAHGESSVSNDEAILVKSPPGLTHFHVGDVVSHQLPYLYIGFVLNLASQNDRSQIVRNPGSLRSLSSMWFSSGPPVRVHMSASAVAAQACGSSRNAGSKYGLQSQGSLKVGGLEHQMRRFFRMSVSRPT